MAKQLIVLAGPDEGRGFTLGVDPLLLGRSRATESHLLDPHVSRVHCQVQVEGNEFVLTDFDSAGGTFVNGNRVSRHVLKPGDIIRIGGTRLQFGDAAEGAPPTAAPAFAAPLATAAAARHAAARPATKTAKRAVKPRVPLARPVASPVAAPVSAPAIARRSEWVHALAGQMLGHFKVGSPLARSKLGYVFHGRDTRRNLAVALKVLEPNFAQNKVAVKRFGTLMKLVLPLRHPHLVRVYGAGKTGPHCWIAMEYVNGESLAAVIGRIETTGMLDWRQVLRVTIFLAQALDYAHQRKLMHQNVTPANILVGRTMQESKLTDLMLAAALQIDPTTPISAAGLPSNDLPYMPPERTDGPGKPVDSRADIYSLGATMYALFTGFPPHRADSVRELVDKIRLSAPASLKSLHLGLPETLEHINQKMLAKRPEDRYPTARELVKHLESFAKAHNVTV